MNGGFDNFPRTVIINAVMKNRTGGEIYIVGIFVLVGSILAIAALTHVLLNP